MDKIYVFIIYLKQVFLGTTKFSWNTKTQGVFRRSCREEVKNTTGFCSNFGKVWHRCRNTYFFGGAEDFARISQICSIIRRGFTIRLKCLKPRAPDFGGPQNFGIRNNFQRFCKQLYL